MSDAYEIKKIKPLKEIIADIDCFEIDDFDNIEEMAGFLKEIDLFLTKKENAGMKKEKYLWALMVYINNFQNDRDGSFSNIYENYSPAEYYNYFLT